MYVCMRACVCVCVCVCIYLYIYIYIYIYIYGFCISVKQKIYLYLKEWWNKIANSLITISLHTFSFSFSSEKIFSKKQTKKHVKEEKENIKIKKKKNGKEKKKKKSQLPFPIFGWLVASHLAARPIVKNSDESRNWKASQSLKSHFRRVTCFRFSSSTPPSTSTSPTTIPFKNAPSLIGAPQMAGTITHTKIRTHEVWTSLWVFCCVRLFTPIRIRYAHVSFPEHSQIWVCVYVKINMNR